MRLKAVPGLQEVCPLRRRAAAQDDALPELFTGIKRYHEWRMESMQELPSLQIWRDYFLAGCGLTRFWKAAAAFMFFYDEHFYVRIMRPEIPAVLERSRKWA